MLELSGWGEEAAPAKPVAAAPQPTPAAPSGHLQPWAHTGFPLCIILTVCFLFSFGVGFFSPLVPS